MVYIRKRYKDGDRRRKKKFLLFPKIIGDELRWLEVAEWEEECTRYISFNRGISYQWEAVKWIGNEVVDMRQHQ